MPGRQYAEEIWLNLQQLGPKRLAALAAIGGLLSAPILRALRDIVRKARAAKKAASLCGEMASKPIGALALIALGYRSLSLSATAHGPVKAMILDLDARKAEAMINPLLDAPVGSVSIREALTKFAETEGLAL